MAIVEAWQSLLNILHADLANKAIIDLLRRDVAVVSLEPSLIHEAVRRQHKYGLDAFDTLQVVSAMASDSSEILTFDKDILGSGSEIPARKP